MSKFDNLTGLLEKLNNDEFGVWHIDEVYDFHEKNPDFQLNRYHDLMEECDLKNIDSYDIDSLDVRGTMALLEHLKELTGKKDKKNT